LVGMFFLLLALGWVLRRAGVLKEPHISWLVGFIVAVPLPALVVGSLVRARYSPALGGVWLLGLLITGMGMLLAWLLGRLLGLRAGTRGVLIVSGTLGNTGFLGTPLIAALYPDQPDTVTAAVTFDMGVTALVVNSAGIAILARCGKADDGFEWRESLRRLMRMPVFWATLIGYGLMLARWQPPALLLFTLDRLGQMTVPLALLTIGAMMRWHTLGIRWRALTLVVAFKCLLMPLLAWGVLHAIALPDFAGRAFLLQSAMPSVMVSAVYASLYQTEPELATAAVVVSAVVALACLPLWLRWFV
ncbi:MAG: AEC family transporter, partial [Fimbriimonadales bacterium]|nr:AEC family transporter [Fimbriimonadales bacterium]